MTEVLRGPRVKLRIGIDLDGVVYPYDRAYRAYLASIGIWTPSETPQSWKFYEAWGWDTDEYWTHHINGINAGIIFGTGQPYPKAVRAINEMRARGHEVHFVTDRNAGRPGYAMQQTAQWLHRSCIGYDGLYFTKLKDVAAGLDVFIDDRPENVDLMASAGVDAYLMDQPWNRGTGEYKRATDLVHFLERIERNDA